METRIHSDHQVHGDIKSIQILRFIAATSVVYTHINVSPNFGSFGVDIFFVLSGFVIALVVSSKQSATVFAISRLTRIVPLYWLLTTLLLFLIYFKPQYVHETTVASATFINYLKSLFFIPYYSADELKPMLRLGWTLNYEMLFYICVWISIISTKKHVLLFSFGFLAAFYLIFGSLSTNKTANGFFGSELIFEFILGILAFKIFHSGKLKLAPQSIHLPTSILSYGLLAYLEVSGHVGNRFIAFGIPSFILVLSVVGLEKYLIKSKSIITSILTNMGDASYATYLTHWYVVVACRKVLDEKLGLYEFYSAPGVTLTLGASLVIGQITYKYVDKPMNRNMKKLILSKFAKPSY